jgi:hypothetical protein
MNVIAAATKIRDRPRYPLQRVVFEGDEVYAFGLWFPTIADFNEFLRLVERADRRDDAARRAEKRPRAVARDRGTGVPR